MARSTDPAGSTVAPRAGRRGEVLKVLRRAPEPLSIADIAARLGVHPNTVRFHLDALVEAGQAQRVDTVTARSGRPPQMFRARTGMDSGGPRNYMLLAQILATDLQAGPDAARRAIAAGRARGRELAETDGPATDDTDAVARLVAILDDLGFAPKDRSDGDIRRIGLRHCPFLELTDDGPGVVCPAHLGLMQGVMYALDAPVTADRLDPFVEPDLCLAHLSRRSTTTRSTRDTP